MLHLGLLGCTLEFKGGHTHYVIRRHLENLLMGNRLFVNIQETWQTCRISWPPFYEIYLSK